MVHTVLVFRKPFPGLNHQANLPNTHTQVRITKRSLETVTWGLST